MHSHNKPWIIASSQYINRNFKQYCNLQFTETLLRKKPDKSKDRALILAKKCDAYQKPKVSFFRKIILTCLNFFMTYFSFLVFYASCLLFFLQPFLQIKTQILTSNQKAVNSNKSSEITLSTGLERVSWFIYNKK